MSNQQLLRSILLKVVEATGISESDILGEDRDGHIIEARQSFRKLLSVNGISNNRIAILTGCNPVTVSSGIKRFDNLFQTDPKFREKMQSKYADLLQTRVKKPVYIIGKVTGLPYKQCFSKFLKREKELIKAGYLVVNPMRLVPQGTTWQEAMKICIAALAQSYAVSPLDDWKQSRGAGIEMNLAQELKMNVIYEVEL